MGNKNISGISLEKIKQSDEERKRISGSWRRKAQLINWAIVSIFSISFIVVLFISIFPIFSVKYQLAKSSFDESIENRIIEDYYKDIANEKRNLPFKDLGENGEIGNLGDYLREETKSLTGSYGIYIKDLKSGEAFGVNKDQTFTAASLSKLFVVADYYHQSRLIPELMESKLILKNEDRVGGNGSIIGDSLGTTYSARYLIKKCLQESDNTAMAILTRVLGMDNVEDFVKKIDLKNTSFYSNDTTPEDMGKFLEGLENREFLDDDLAKEMLIDMQKTLFEDRLPYYLPEGVRVAHKIGTWEGAYSDAGIIYGNNSKYVIVVMTDGVYYEEAVNMIRKISEVTYEYMDF